MTPRLRLSTSIVILTILVAVLPASNLNAQAASQTPKTFDIVVATKTITDGTKITADMVTVCPWPTAILSTDSIERPEAIIGHYARGTINAKSPVTSVQLLDRPLTVPGWPVKPVPTTPKKPVRKTATQKATAAFTCPNIDKLTKVVVTTMNIPAELTLTDRIVPQAFKLQDWPVEAVPAGAITDFKKMTNLISQVDIYRGLVVQGTMFGKALPTTYLGYIVVRISFDSLTTLTETRNTGSFYADLYAFSKKTNAYTELVVKKVFLMTLREVQGQKMYYLYVPEAAKRTAIAKLLKAKRLLLAKEIKAR